MSDTTASAVRPYHVWLRRGAIVMALATSAVFVVMMAWFGVVSWREEGAGPRLFRLAATLVGVLASNWLVVVKIRDGEIRAPLRLALTCVMYAVLIAMTVKMGLLLMHIGQD